MQYELELTIVISTSLNSLAPPKRHSRGSSVSLLASPGVVA